MTHFLNRLSQCGFDRMQDIIEKYKHRPTSISNTLITFKTLKRMPYVDMTERYFNGTTYLFSRTKNHF